MTQEWTPERTAALITLWNDGVCASEIGRRLGITKNAVIGKAFRLQLAKRRPSSSSASSAAPVDDTGIIRLDRLGANMCSWPMPSPENGDYHFCGAPTEPGKPYCAAHCREAYLPAPRMRKAAVGA